MGINRAPNSFSFTFSKPTPPPHTHTNGHKNILRKTLLHCTVYYIMLVLLNWHKCYAHIFYDRKLNCIKVGRPVMVLSWHKTYVKIHQFVQRLLQGHRYMDMMITWGPLQPNKNYYYYFVLRIINTYYCQDLQVCQLACSFSHSLTGTCRMLYVWPLYLLYDALLYVVH
jgi:hypothetical protein